ncbi:MAG TPA: hypothetical protein VIL18_00850 [Longimicrobiales bacterium]
MNRILGLQKIEALGALAVAGAEAEAEAASTCSWLFCDHCSTNSNAGCTPPIQE